MKFLKWYLAIVTALLVLALGIGVYVWYMLQSLERDITTEGAESAPKEEMTTDEEAIGTTREETPITIDAASLTPTQRQILESFGYQGGALTITKAMITCAEQAVGEVRLGQIVNGSAPSPLEALKLIPCFKKSE